jgi:hypothetical protein
MGGFCQKLSRTNNPIGQASEWWAICTTLTTLFSDLRARGITECTPLGWLSTLCARACKLEFTVVNVVGILPVAWGLSFQEIAQLTNQAVPG